jgi:hypothetical protein
VRYRGVAFLLLGVLAPALALAQSPEDALLNECYTLRRAGRHDASLPRCEEAASRFPSGRSLTQLALTEMALERWAAAATHLTSALADHTHPWMQPNRPSVEDALRTVRPRVGVLEVDTNIPDATVSVPGSAPAPASGPVFASPGRVTVILRAEDGRTVTRNVALVAGQTTHERMDFPAAPTNVAANTTAAPLSLPPPPDRPLPSSLPATRTSTRRVLAWTAGGVALASFGLALVSWRVREGVVSDYLAACPAATSTAEGCGARWDTADGEASQWETLTTVGLVAGGAFALTSAILFVTEPSRSPSATTWICAPSVGLAGGHCAVRF